MDTFPKALRTYFKAWNTFDAGQRKTLIETCFTANTTYTDPHAPKTLLGAEQMAAMLDTFRERLDHLLIPTSDLDMHHDVFRVGWKLEKETGEKLSDGLMVGTFDQAGALSSIITFVN